MSISRTSNFRRAGEHFEPDELSDPHAQRQLRGKLEHIDYTAYVSNRAVLAKAIGHVDAEAFQRLGVAAAQARGQWVAQSLAVAKTGAAPSAAEVLRLAEMRKAYEELAAAYDALRRMVERGYVQYGGGPASTAA